MLYLLKSSLPQKSEHLLNHIICIHDKRMAVVNHKKVLHFGKARTLNRHLAIIFTGYEAGKPGLDTFTACNNTDFSLDRLQATEQAFWIRAELLSGRARSGDTG
jgi:hypothetical protein